MFEDDSPHVVQFVPFVERFFDGTFGNAGDDFSGKLHDGAIADGGFTTAAGRAGLGAARQVDQAVEYHAFCHARNAGGVKFLFSLEYPRDARVQHALLELDDLRLDGVVVVRVVEVLAPHCVCRTIGGLQHGIVAALYFYYAGARKRRRSGVAFFLFFKIAGGKERRQHGLDTFEALCAAARVRFAPGFFPGVLPLG